MLTFLLLGESLNTASGLMWELLVNVINSISWKGLMAIGT